MNRHFYYPVRFHAGAIHVTPSIQRLFDQSEVENAVKKHYRGDWGRLSFEDARRNEMAIEKGGRITSSFVSKNGIRFWVTTEPDRSKTTVLLPRDNRDNNRPKRNFIELARGFFRRLFH